MNYMKQIAEMLGVELEEEFFVKSRGGKYTITNNGLYWRSDAEWQKAALTFEDILCGKAEINKKPILNEAEKEYLSSVIKPFRDRAKCIINDERHDKEFICIELEHEDVLLPHFEPNTMYKGMELYKGYTLEDLDL